MRGVALPSKSSGLKGSGGGSGGGAGVGRGWCKAKELNFLFTTPQIFIKCAVFPHVFRKFPYNLESM